MSLIKGNSLLSRTLAWWYMPPLRGHIYSSRVSNALLGHPPSLYKNGTAEDKILPATWDVETICPPLVPGGGGNVGLKYHNGFQWLGGNTNLTDNYWTASPVWMGTGNNWHFTVSFWILPITPAPANRVCMMRWTGFYLYMETGYYALGVTPSTVPVVEDVPVHVTFTQEQYGVVNASRLYLDGKLVLTGAHADPGYGQVTFLGDLFNQSAHALMRDIRFFKTWIDAPHAEWLYRDALRGYDTQMLHRQSKRRSYFSPVTAAAGSGQRIFGGGWGGRVIAQMKEAA